MPSDPKSWTWAITSALMLAAIVLAIVAVVRAYALMFGTF